MALIPAQYTTLAATAFILMLVAGCTMFGGDPQDPMDELREQIRLTVSDEERSGAMLVVVDKLDDKLIELSELVADAVRNERDLFTNYDSSRQDYELFFRQTSRERERLQRSLIEIHIELKSYLSDDEWDVILPVQTRALAAKSRMLTDEALAKRAGA